MTSATNNVEALILAAGEGNRLGRGPKALLRLGKHTLVERAVAVAQEIADNVIVGVPSAHVDSISNKLGNNTMVLPGGRTRIETMLSLFRESSAPCIVVHDIVHPFVTATLLQSVVAVARDKGAATAAIRNTEYLYEGNKRFHSRIRAEQAIWQVQKPFAFMRRLFAAAIERRGDTLSSDTGALDILLEAGVPFEIVHGMSWNIKVTTRSDWALAQLIDGHGSLLDGAVAAESS